MTRPRRCAAWEAAPSSSSRVPTSLIGTRSWFIHPILQVFHFSAFKKIRPGQVGLSQVPMKLPQLLHSTRSYGRVNSAFSWKLLVLERGFLSYRLKLPCDRSEKDAWFGYSPVGL